MDEAKKYSKWFGFCASADWFDENKWLCSLNFETMLDAEFGKNAAEMVKWLIVNEKIHNIVEINVLQMRNLSTAN